MNIYYFTSALLVLFGGILIVAKSHKGMPLKLLSFFVIASMFRPVTDSHWAWLTEMVFIAAIASFRKPHVKDLRWYLLFLAMVLLSFVYSDNPARGVPGFVMYVFPLFYYALTTTAVKRTTDAYELFNQISKASWLVLLISAISFFRNPFVFSYYGMGICMIPALLFCKTGKKQYVFHYLICFLPALVFVKRTPLLGIAAATILFSLLIYKWKALIPGILAILIGATLVLSIPGFMEKTFSGTNITGIQDLSRESANQVNLNGRLEFWNIVLDKYYKTAPVFGSGIGTVKAFLQSDQNEYKRAFSLMHNDWLLVLCEQGLSGTFLLLLFMLGVLRKGIRYSAERYPKELRLIAAACAGSAVSTVIHMFFENCMNSFVFSTTFVFYAILNSCAHGYAKKVPVR